MGSLVTVPLEVLGSCLGSCVAVSCFKLADSGSVSTMEAVRCVLTSLQVFGAGLAWTASAAPKGWAQSACDKLALVGFGGAGICECRGDANEASCWSDQLVYRATLAVTVVFLALLLLGLGGCAASAARSHETGKFMAIPLLWLLLFAAPNSALSHYGVLAAAMSCAFIVVQSVVFLDAACTLHEKWYEHARGASRRQLHQTAIVAVSSVLLLGSIGFTMFLWSDFPRGFEHHIILAVEVVAWMLLVLSITEWCEHGTLLTSAIMTLYSTWLLHEALAMVCPDWADAHSVSLVPAWMRLLLGFLTVSLLAQGRSLELSTSEAPAGQALLGAAADEAPATTEPAPASAFSESDKHDFVLRCAVHAVVPFYVCSALVSFGPQRSCGTSVLYVVAVFACQLIYGWHLVAPKVLRGRRF